MQGISIYKRETADILSSPIYHTFHERNGKYLERENEPSKFLVLKDIDDCDPSEFYTSKGLNDLLSDLEIIVLEAKTEKDIEIANHLKEIVVLCKLCLWNIDAFVLIISPYEYLEDKQYPVGLPGRYKFNISFLP